ncbi:hypothetical protein H310_09425 [Aphanomyces invadans]|uniref:Palmitoyl-protein thioesterase 1 n=1 Tax=Aphanomyces invadans TaxID=157072 RepID=A0A024TU14_9STRA|nr:hypothetical protein H310_09425 [Aphanomyces invadans]ETV97503.1 hypothetical protein H310_09425 [Aphanomyces invadans]|eukprot:XP_008873712.1 hypothetical protein H310_09425 [Aphanomyces invadans]
MRVGIVGGCLWWTSAAANLHGRAVWQPESFLADDRLIVDVDGDYHVGELGGVEGHVDRNTLPVVIMHGMGDAAQNPGMQRLRKAVATRLGGYATNVQIGASQAEDTSNGFFMNLDKQVDYFARVVAADEHLRHGFNALGFSQGNLVVRGYIERYNSPPVKSFVSIHGPLAGVAGLPHCRPINFICKKISDLISAAAYADSVQDNVAQANYFRDPTRISEYKVHARFLPDINNEHGSKNATFKANFANLEQLVLVRAAQDSMVYPRESEWFGAYEDGAFDKVLLMNETKWYQDDSFGLKTLNEAGKITLKETAGDHLRIPTETLLSWIEQYFV